MDLKVLHKKLKKEMVEAFPNGSKHGVDVRVEVADYGIEVSIKGFYCPYKAELPYAHEFIGLHPKEKCYTLKQAISAFRELLLPTDNKIELND